MGKPLGYTEDSRLYVRCPLCAREVRGRIPSRGDGTAALPVNHKVDGAPCPGIYETVSASDGVTWLR